MIKDMSLIINEISCRNEQVSLKRIIDNIESEIEDILTASKKKERKFIGLLSIYLQYFKEPYYAINTIKSILDTYIERLYSSNPKISNLLAKKIDCFLYLLFDLMSKDEIYDKDFARYIDIIIIKKIKATLFVSAIRKNFAKGISLLNINTKLIHHIEHIGTDNAKEFIIINISLTNNKIKKNIFISILNSLPNNNIKELAKDLRRSTVKDIHNSDSLDLQDLSELFSSTNDTEIIFSKLLICSYAGYINKKNLIYLCLNTPDNVWKAKLNILLSLFGYDFAFISHINKIFLYANIKNTLPRFSLANDIINYFTTCLKKWSRNFSVHTSKNSSLPEVSIIISTYNPNLELLKLSLRSIAIQSYPNIEIVFYDDCSDNNTENEIYKLVLQESFLSARKIKYIRNDKSVGQYCNRNSGINIASGEYIGLQDDDDISHPDRISVQMKNMLNNKKLVASHVKHLRIAMNSRLMLDGDNLCEPLGNAPPSFIWRRDVFNDIGFFIPTKTRGDVEFYKRLISYYGDELVKQIDIPLLLMRGDFVTVSSNSEYMFKSSLEALRYMIKHINFRTTHNIECWIPNRFSI